jgi:hypothetical protein
MPVEAKVVLLKPALLAVILVAIQSGKYANNQLCGETTLCIGKQKHIL